MDISITLNQGANLYIGNDGSLKVGSPEDVTGITELKEELDSLRAENRKLTEINSSLSATVLEKNEKIASFGNAIREYSDRADTEAEEKEKYMDRVKDLERDVEELIGVNGLYEAGEKELKEKIARLTEENMKLKGTVESLKAGLNGKTGRCLLIYGDENDLFTDEVKDYVLEAVAGELKDRTAENSRKNDVLSDILTANRYGSLHEQMRKDIKDRLSSEDGNIGKALEAFGFVKAEETNTHVKYRYHGDERYTTSVSVSASDYRSSLNQLSEAIRSYM